MKFVTRIAAFLGKEIIEVIRRPGAIFSLLLGPFIIMALFGFGYVGRQPLQVIVVVPENSTLPHDTGFYQKLGGNGLNIAAVTPDAEGAREKLRQKQVDLVAIAPSDAEQKFKEGKQSVIEIDYDIIDPVKSTSARSPRIDIATAIRMRSRERPSLSRKSSKRKRPSASVRARATTSRSSSAQRYAGSASTMSPSECRTSQTSRSAAGFPS